MGIKRNIKKWLSFKLKNLIEFDNLPVLIKTTQNLISGKESFHNGGFQVKGTKKVKIGSYCTFGSDIKLITSNHNYNIPVLQYSFYKKHFGKTPKNNSSKEELSIEIGNDVWIGDNVSILPNVKVGNGAIIGTGSVVTKDISDYVIVAGVPAKYLKDRFSDEVKKKLISSKWWTWNNAKIKENEDFFFKKYNHNE